MNVEDNKLDNEKSKKYIEFITKGINFLEENGKNKIF
jgi:hypothetical protein